MKLIAIDLDGTLLSDDGKISRENVDAIMDVKKKGDTVVICSGRAHHDTKKILESAGIDCPIISGNGALSYLSNRFIKKLFILDVLDILKELVDKSFYFELYTSKGILLPEKGRVTLENEMNKLNLVSEWASNNISNQFKQHGLIYYSNLSDFNVSKLEVYKIFVVSFDQDRLNRLQQILLRREDISINNYGLIKLEIAHREVSKGNALAYMAKHLNIPLTNTLVIGDHFNDLSMFEVAGISIAMENAEDEVKKNSTYITKSNNANGVAYALQHYL